MPTPNAQLFIIVHGYGSLPTAYLYECVGICKRTSSALYIPINIKRLIFRFRLRFS